MVKSHPTVVGMPAMPEPNWALSLRVDPGAKCLRNDVGKVAGRKLIEFGVEVPHWPFPLLVPQLVGESHECGELRR